MKISPRYKMPFSRRVKKKTNYKRRLGMLYSGEPRLVVRRSSKHMKAQIIIYERDGDKVLANATTQELEALGWKGSTSNIPAAYLVGLLIGKKAAKKKVSSAILDIGLQRNISGSKIYAALKGAVDAGLEIPHDAEIFPSEDRISGKHIANYAKTLKEADSKKFKVVFTKTKPDETPKMFESVKSKIMKG
jgi:large subunit ribosomal protein L18